MTDWKWKTVDNEKHCPKCGLRGPSIETVAQNRKGTEETASARVRMRSGE